MVQVWQEAAPVYFFLVAFSAALVTENSVRKREKRGRGKVRTLATLLSLLDGLDDTDSNGLPHITDGETTERWVLVVALDTHGLAGDKLGNTGITRLDELGRVLKRLPASPVNLLNQLGKLASNVGSMAIQDGGITRTNLTGVVEDDDLSVERSGLLSGIVLGVGSDVSTADILDRDVLDVETDVITRLAGLKLLVVHFDRLDFSGNVCRGESNDHAGLDDTRLDTTDGHCSNTTDFIDILEREPEGLIGRAGRGLDGIDGVQEGLTLDGAGLVLLGPALVPGHAVNGRSENWSDLCDERRASLG